MLSERIAKKIDKTSTCWLWTATTNDDGYGLVRYGGRVRAAHRVRREAQPPPRRGLLPNHRPPRLAVTSSASPR